MSTHKPLWIVRKVPEHKVEPTLTRLMDDADALGARLGPIVDSNIHLWDQSLNAVFWLSDRGMLRSMLGPYDSLPDRYVVEDYRQATAGLAVSGAVWSDPGTDDPLAAIDWVREQNEDGLLVGLVTLADPAKTSFASLVDLVRGIDLLTTVPFKIDWHEKRTCYAQAVIDRIDRQYIPGLKEKIIGMTVMSPVDYEADIASALHGTVTHGAMTLYQRAPCGRRCGWDNIAGRSRGSISARGQPSGARRFDDARAQRGPGHSWRPATIWAVVAAASAVMPRSFCLRNFTKDRMDTRRPGKGFRVPVPVLDILGDPVDQLVDTVDGQALQLASRTGSASSSTRPPTNGCTTSRTPTTT